LGIVKLSEFDRKLGDTRNLYLIFELYRELLEFSRDQKIPVIGLNVTKALGRKVSMTPLDKLDQETREQLPEMDMSDPYQREMIEKIFAAHEAGAPIVESFFRRQTLWDETMAATVTDYMREHPDHHMVIIAGGRHVNYGFGIPRRVHRRLPLPYALVGGHNLEVSDEKLDQLMDVQISNFPMRAVDYLVYQEYEVFKSKGVRLGVMLDDSDDHVGVLVTDRVSGSAAAEAGINKGDRLLRFDGVPLEDSFDLIYAVKSKRPGDSATIELKRGDETLVAEAYFGLEQ
jgi:C-terminal processing protease CtpA/Prc